ncbi:glycosyltransferase family 39 protein [Thermoanaerobacterium sp. RBIITD]|uniref:glycosyltransferase family 39 protein n=1 Tax=Thermoanaerobacterium sp. RBIITD TaxID=1550240 RepID=UPI000BB7DCEC|nr:glycosyltransferase family 39 protein [Thermoanaerobacterium sp. RBIITD]SNX53585.1 Dolichyl-phosphate-mannose-protein mannosyltransferase [Thermoanaerobacterium sp. RBIITD]
MKKIKISKEMFALSLILLLSAILNFTNLSIEGYANQYYAAGVKSMTMSLKNFFFVSFDPAGFVSIDKPPLGFWIQAISAKLFGFSGWSLIFPQALAGVISVAIMYIIVKRSFGSAAGLIAALSLAVTPVFVADSRNNTIDNLLVLTLLLACLALSIAAEKGKLKYLILSLGLVGIGFNIKMLQAYMIVPALYITYLISSAIPIKKRISHLIIGTVILLLVSLSWAIVVDLVPAGSRPYVGSSTNNTVMELIVGHNGLERLGIGGTGAPGGRNQGKGFNGQGQPGNFNVQGQTVNSDNATSSATKTGQYGQGVPGSSFNGDSQRPGIPGTNGQDGMTPGFGGRNMQRPGGGMGGTFGGREKASIIRLFSNNSLSDQIIWLFPLAIFGFVSEIIRKKLKRPFNSKEKLSLILWITWLLPVFIYFSFTTGLFHPYYLTMLAPPIAALCGIGIVSMWQLYKEGGWKSWILPAALITDGLIQMLILSYYYKISSATKVIMIALSVLCFVSSAILIIVNLIKSENTKIKKILVSTAIAGLLIAPTVWSATTMFYPMSGTFPSAGLGLASNKGMMDFNTNTNDNRNTKLIKFLEKNKGNAKYLLVVSSAQSAEDIIIKTGEPVMALGGFSGSDNILSLNQFKQLVKKGEIRYVMVGGMGIRSSNDIMNWVKENGKVVSESEWKDSNLLDNQQGSGENNINSGNQNFGGFGDRNFEQLYDLKGIYDNL